MNTNINKNYIIEIFGKENINQTTKPKIEQKQTKINDAQKKILEIFDKYDSEQTGEIDIYQLQRYFLNEWKVQLSEDTIKYHCNQTFSEKANKIQKKEFISFHKYVSGNIEEIKKETVDDIYETFENQYLSTSTVDQHSRYLDRNLFIISNEEKPRTILFPDLTKPKNEDVYHSKMYNFLFEKTTSLCIKDEPYQNIFIGKEISGNVGTKIENLFSVDSIMEMNTNTKVLSRRKRNKHLFQFYNPKLSEEDLLYSTSLSNIQKQNLINNNKKKLVRVIMSSVMVNVPCEDLYFKFSLYDQEYNKLCSTYHFTVSANDLIQCKTQYAKLNITPVTVSMREEFISGKEECFVVIEVYKMADTDIDSIKELYSDDASKETKSRNKYTDKMKNIKSGNETYKQLLLFSSSSIRFKGHYELKLYKPNTDYKDIVSMMKDIDKMKSAGNIEFDFKPSTANVINHEGLSMYQNINIEKKTRQNVKSITTDSQPVHLNNLTDFATNDRENIHLDFQNLMFVYPTEVSLGKERKKDGIFINVYLRNVDTKFTQSCELVSCIYPLENKLIEKYVSSYRTSVSSEKIAHFFDEIKMDLPFPMNEKYHLLFEINDFDIQHQQVFKTYYAKIPLFQSGEIIESKEHIVPIMRMMTHNYLKDPDSHDITKMYLKINVKFVSTVYPKYPIIQNVILEKPNVRFETLLEKNYKKDIIHYFPIILERFIDQIEKEDEESIAYLFKLFEMVDPYPQPSEEMYEKNRVYKQEMISDAINHFLPIKKLNQNKYYFEILLQKIPTIFSKTPSFAKIRLKYSWVIFAIIIKSIIGYYNENNVFDCPNFHDFCVSKNGQRVGQDLEKCVKEFSEFMKYTQEQQFVDPIIIRDANIYFGEFIRELACLWKHDEVARIIDNHFYIISMMKFPDVKCKVNISYLLRLEFAATIIESQQLYRLNAPQPLEIKEISKLQHELQTKQTIIFILMRQFFNLILSNDKVISKMALNELLILINKYDLDTVYTTAQEKRVQFANMILPFILFILDDYDKFIDWKQKTNKQELFEMELVYLIFFFVLKNLREKTIQDWLLSDYVESLLSSLLTHLRISLMLFSRFPIPFISNPSKVYVYELNLILFDLLEVTYTNSDEQIPVIIPQSTHGKLSISSKSSDVSRKSIFLKRGESDLFGSFGKKDEQSAQTSDRLRNSQSQVLNTRQRSGLNRSGENSIESTLSKVEIEEIKVDIALITMDIIELVLGMLVNSKHETSSKSFELAQEIISSVLFEVSTCDYYLKQLYDFIKIVLATHGDFIFNKPNTLGLNLTKNLLNFANSSNESQRNFANNLLFIMAKTNFILTNDTEKQIINSTNALSELELTSNEFLLKSVGEFEQLALKYHQNFDSRLQQCIEESLQEGVRRNKSLQKVHKLYKALEVGDLDAFIVFSLGYCQLFKQILEFVSNAEPTLINGYAKLKKDVVSMLQERNLFNLLTEWVEVIKEKYNSININLIDCLKEKYQLLLVVYSDCSKKYNQLPLQYQQDELEMEQFEKECQSHKLLGEQMLNWIKQTIIVEELEKQPTEESEIVSFISELEMNQTERRNEINALLNEYVLFDARLKEFGLESNPLFPVTSEKMKDGVKRVLQIHQTKIKAMVSYLQTTTSVAGEREEFLDKMQRFEKDVEKQFENICQDIHDLPSTELFMKQFVTRMKKLNRTYKRYDSTLVKKKQKMGGLKETWDIEYDHLDETITVVLSTVEWIEQLVDNITSNENNIDTLKKWYDNERVFILKTIDTYLWNGLYEMIEKVHMRDSNDYLKSLSNVTQYLLKTMNISKISYEEAQKVITELKSNKRTPKGLQFFEKIHLENFNKIKTINETYMKKWEEEQKLENIRKEYARLNEEFFDMTDQLMTNQDSQEVVEEILQKVKSHKDTLSNYDQQKIDKLIRYCNLQRSEQTVWARCATLNLNSKEESKFNTPRKSNLQSILRGSTPRTTSFAMMASRRRNNEETTDISSMFLDEKEDWFIDRFNDLSFEKRQTFVVQLKRIQDEMMILIGKLSNLNVIKTFSNDPQFRYEKNYQFAMDYVSAPQLHISWIKKLSSEYLQKQYLTEEARKAALGNQSNAMYIESAMCEVYLILFIHNYLPKNTTSIDVTPLKQLFGKFVPEITTQPNIQFTSIVSEEMLLTHIKSACMNFEKGKLPWYGIQVAEISLPYYMKSMKFKELGETHEYIDRMYSMLVESQEQMTNFIYFYVAFYGKKAFTEELVGKSFIYFTKRENESLLVSELKGNILESFKGEVNIVSSLRHITPNVINPPDTKCHIVMCGVTPQYQNGEKYSHRFIVDEFAPKSKVQPRKQQAQTPHLQVIELTKNRTIFETNCVLPSLLARQSVVSTETIHLDGMRLVIESLERRKNGIIQAMHDVKINGSEGDEIRILQKVIKENFFGSKNMIDQYSHRKLYDIIDIFFKDMTIFEIHRYKDLLNILQDISNVCYEGIMVIKNMFKERTSSQTLDLLMRECVKIDDTIERYEKKYLIQSDEIHDNEVDN